MSKLPTTSPGRQESIHALSVADAGPPQQYSGKADGYFEYARPEMLPFVPTSARRILEIGCGSGTFGASVKARQATHYIGIELSDVAVALAKEQIDQVLCLDIEATELPFPSRCFDCIVCNDVLEHLVEPWAAVQRLKGHLAPGGRFVASIPNIRYFEVMKEVVVRGEWRYQDEGVLDRTHLRFFTRTTIVELFRQAGLAIEEIRGINGGAFPWKFGLLNLLLANRLDDMRWRQFACVSSLPLTGPGQ